MSNLNNFHYGMVLMNTLYGIDMPEDEWEEIALVGWNRIGNKRYKLYSYKVCVNDCTTSIDLPCNADIIEAVTTGWEDWNNVSNIYPDGDIYSAHTEAYIESRKGFLNPLYNSGKYIKYEQVGNTLYFKEPYGLINILYKGIQVDDSGLPELTDKEALAIATYCAYVTKFKEGLATNSAAIINAANMLRQLWLIQCDLARVTEYLNQNDMDLALDAKSSWNRKLFGKSYKPLR